MTRKEEQAKWRGVALAYYEERGAQGIKADIDAIREPRDISIFDAIKRLVSSGNFACSYYGIEQDIKSVYGTEYDKSRYYTKSGDLKYRGDDAYIVSVYTAKMAKAIEQIIMEAR
jgi:hypothetical protein